MMRLWRLLKPVPVRAKRKAPNVRLTTVDSSRQSLVGNHATQSARARGQASAGI